MVVPSSVGATSGTVLVVDDVDFGVEAEWEYAGMALSWIYKTPLEENIADARCRNLGAIIQFSHLACVTYELFEVL